MRPAFNVEMTQGGAYGDTLLVPVEALDRVDLAGYLGTQVLLYEGARSSTQVCVGIGRFIALESQDDRFAVRIDQRVDLNGEHMLTPTEVMIRSSWRGVRDSEFEAIFSGEFASPKGTHPSQGFSEQAQVSLSPAEGADMTAASLLELKTRVFDAFGHCCAVTEPGVAGTQALAAVYIRPVAEHGVSDVSNCLLLGADAARAWGNFEFTIGSDNQIIVDYSRASRAFLKRMNPHGVLRNPNGYVLDRGSLDWHRSRFRDITGL